MHIAHTHGGQADTSVEDSENMAIDFMLKSFCDILSGVPLILNSALGLSQQCQSIVVLWTLV